MTERNAGLASYYKPAFTLIVRIKTIMRKTGNTRHTRITRIAHIARKTVIARITSITRKTRKTRTWKRVSRELHASRASNLFILNLILSFNALSDVWHSVCDSTRNKLRTVTNAVTINCFSHSQRSHTVSTKSKLLLCERKPVMHYSSKF